MIKKNDLVFRLKPQFPSYTFPNHYTLATGLYLESHGMIGNVFYDYQKNILFQANNASVNKIKDFWQAEPIWSTAERKGLKAAVISWPGSEVYRPSRLVPYKRSITAKESFEIALNWMRDSRIGLLMIHISEVDRIGHAFGPNSLEMSQTLGQIEMVLDDFYANAKLIRPINMIILSDHGMSHVEEEKILFIDRILDKKRVKYWICGPSTSIYPFDVSDTEQIYFDLKDVIDRKKLPIKIWLKEDLPLDFHLGHNHRTAPIMLEAFSGWTIDSLDAKSILKGLHGYNPLDNKDMHAIFMGRGPNIIPGNINGMIDNVEVYQALTKLLSIKGNPHNGTGILEKYIKLS